ncbi:MAG: DNA repair protein RecN [Lachnospiraceae bacterium]|nr:DNA repair protein RecN [Lachnospiraceae bacterium]
MLQSIHVKNLALIEETESYFTEGLNIITGETGAGKSLLIGSVNLALGGKFDASMLRQGSDSGYVELVFVSKDKKVLDKLREMEIEPEDDGQIILTRKLMQGKSSCRINGETVTVKQVQSLAEELIDIHGQHEHQSLLKKSKHLEILDAYGEKEIKVLLEKTSRCFSDYKKALAELKENEKDSSEVEREKSLLEFEVNEIESACLKEDEDVLLEEKYSRMSNARKIVEALGEAYSATSESEGNASQLVGQALRNIVSVSNYDKRLEALVGQISDIESLLNDFNRDLSGFLADYDFEEGEFESVTERLDLINDLKRKYGDSISKILDYAGDASERLGKLSDYEGYIKSLRERSDKLYGELTGLCGQLTKARKKVAERLSKELKESLIGLNFLTVEFEISIKPLDEPSAKGADEVEFMISTNPGEGLKPLGSVASGGELSRIMLGIKTVMAEQDSTDTLIFDEIDAGISGRTAWKVSEKLGLLGRRHQVLCITHLPQIAAMADSHFVIEKSTENKATHTSVRCIEDEESVRELARLLGSDEESKAALENARDMKEQAANVKRGYK